MGRFVSRVVVDAEGVPLVNAVGQIFDIADEDNLSPLDIYDAAGSSFALDELKSNGDGVTPEFNTPTAQRVKWVSGPFTVDMLSWDTVPEGGTVGQVLAKTSDTDFDLSWQNQQAAIPAGFLGQTVVGNDIGAFLGIAEVREPYSRDAGKAKQFGGFDATVAGQDV